MINSRNINPKTCAEYDWEILDNQCTKEELNLPGYVLYYLSKTYSDPVIGSYIPEHLRKEVIEHCHEIMATWE